MPHPAGRRDVADLGRGRVIGKERTISLLTRVGTFVSEFLSPFLGAKHRSPLGRVLVAEGLITEEQLKKALEVQKRKSERLGKIIVEEGFASEVDVLTAISKYYGISAAALSDDLEDRIRKRHLSFLQKVASLRLPIRVKLSIMITFIIWLTILILSFVILARQRGSLYQQTVNTGRVSLNYFAGDAAIPLLEDDIVRLNSLIKEAASVKELAYAAIIGRDGAVRAHTDQEKIGTAFTAVPKGAVVTREETVSYYTFLLPDGRHVLDLFRPVLYSGKELGTIHVGISLDFIDGQIRRESMTIILLSLFIVILGIAIAIMIGVGFSRPISQLVLATREIGKGNFQYKIDMLRGDELGDLATAFNYMSQELWKKLILQKSFGKYVSQEVLQMVLAKPEDTWLKGTRSEASVLFADIRDFTTYSETREPEEVVEALNACFEIATQCILDHGGYVDKFIGDAVLGVFGVPVARPDHALRAVRCGIAMQEALKAKVAAGGNPLLATIGISIHAGVLVAGNIGSQVKIEYTVIGDTVNTAARLNAFAEAGRVVVSQSVIEAVRDVATVRALAPQKVKGKAEPLPIYVVESLGSG